MVLKKGQYFVQTLEEQVMRIMLLDRKIALARIPESETEEAKEVEA